MLIPTKLRFFLRAKRTIMIITIVTFLAVLMLNAFQLRSKIFTDNIVVFMAVGDYSSEENSVSMDHNSADFPTTTGSEHPMEKIFQERREKVRHFCSMGNIYEDLNFTLTDSIDFFWDYNVSVCRMGKVACTTWQHYLLELNNRNHTKQSRPKADPRHKDMMSQSNSHLLHVIKSTIKILPVRHPLTRIVSGYRHMFKNGAEMKWNDLFYWKHFAVTAYYHAGLISPEILKEAGVTTIRHMAMSDKVYSKITRSLKKHHITFTEFIRHLVSFKNSGEIDRHWNPYSDLASPCILDYEYIVKVETMDEETDYLFQKLNFPLKKARKNVRSKFDNSDDKEDDYFSYFNDVPLDLKEQLYAILKTDFDMFNYSLPRNFWSPQGL